MMNKYSVPNDLVRELLDLQACETEEEALEKVASGEALYIIKKAKLQHISDFLSEANNLLEVNLAEEVGIDVAEEVNKLKDSLEE